ncbi:MAG: hypothetical protein J0H20_11370 [Rhizobiales bacterium]|nr:hypothetical protein [Hyphomicrobiales bacterium]
MTLANDVPSDLPRFFSFFQAPEPKASLVKRPPEARELDKADDADTTSDFVWALAYWPWL